MMPSRLLLKNLFYVVDKSGKWHVLRGSLPTENLPKPTPRRALNYSRDVSLPEVICYEALDDIQKDLKHVKYPWQIIPGIEGKLFIGKLSANLEISSKIIVGENLCVKICWFGVELPASHFLYEQNGTSLMKKRIQWLIKEIDELNVCRGVTEESLISYGSLPTEEQSKKAQKFYLHVTAKPTIPDECQTPIVYEQCIRSTSCEFLSKLTNHAGKLNLF